MLMINFVQSPWKNTRMRTWRNLVISMLLMIIISISYLAVFSTYTSKAQEVRGQTECTSIRLVGDAQGVFDTDAGIKNLVKDRLGITDFSTLAENGRNIRKTTFTLENSNARQHCLIVETGSGDLLNSEERIREDVRKAIQVMSSAPKVFWVTPVLDDARDGRTAQPNKLNDIIREELTKSRNNNIEIVNIQQLSTRSELFTDQVWRMTDEGYKKRIDLIVSHIENSLKPESSETETPGNSSTPAPAPAPAPGGGSGGSGGGSGRQIYNNGANDGKNGPSVACSPAEIAAGTCEGVDRSPSSPKETFERIQQINTFGDAKPYLMAQRWSSITFPTRPFSFEEPSTIMSSAFSWAAGISMALSSFCMRLLQDMMIAVAGDGMPSVAMRISNYIFGTITGGVLDTNRAVGEGSQSVRLSVIATSIVTIALVFALLNAMRPGAGGSLKQRGMTILWAVVKSMLSILFLVFVSYQSSKEPSASGFGGFGDTEQGSVDIFDSAGTNGGDGQMRGGQRFQGEYNMAGDYSSWGFLSLGWIMSFGYWLGSEVAGAVYAIGAVLVLRPMELIGKITTSTDMETHPACDRYADAINLAFHKTKVGSTNKSVSSLLSTLDYVFYTYHFHTYKILYGGQTFQAGNSFCTVLEKENRVPPGEILLMARSAGMLKEFAGIGNIMDDAGKYTNGEHSYSSWQNNLSPGMAASKAGYAVNSDGTWVDDKEFFNATLRTEYFLGIKGSASATGKANWYLASCYWDPAASRSELHSSWQNARPMGVTGAVAMGDGSPLPPLEYELHYGTKEGDAPNEGTVRKTELYKGWAQSDFVGNSEALTGMNKTNKQLVDETFDTLKIDEGEEDDNGMKKDKTRIPSPNSPVMNNADCENTMVLPMDQLRLGDALTGWNSSNHWAERWNYNPMPPKPLAESLGNVVRDVVNNTPAIRDAADAGATLEGIVKGAKAVGDFLADPVGTGIRMGAQVRLALTQSDGGDSSGDGEDAVLNVLPPENKINPASAFGSTVAEDGKNPAYAFWDISTGGSSGTLMVLATLIVLIISLSISIALSIPVVIVLIFNFIMSILILIFGFLLMFSLVAFAFRGGRR